MPRENSDLQLDPEVQEETSLRDIIKNTNEVLASASMSLGLVRYKLILARASLIYERRSGFAAVSIKSIHATDIQNVTGSINPFFGVLYFDHISQDFPKQVGIFWREDVIRMKRIIKGYAVALKQNTSYDAIPLNKLVPMLEELGTDDKSITH